MRNTKNTTGKIITLVNLTKQYKKIKKDINKSISGVLERGWYILGQEVSAFEREFADYIGVKYAVGVASGTDALTISLKALGLKQDDEVIVPANVYPTVFGVALSGLKVRLADVDNNTLNITVDTIKKVASPKTKAVIVVHLYGNPVDIDPILKYADENGVYIIEDCSHAVGAEYKNQKVGTLGHLACFSFYPTKNLGAYGDGGMIVTNSTEFYEKIKLWRMYGEEGRYSSILIGHNSRLDEIQAAVLRQKLKYLDLWNTKRINLAGFYQKRLKKLPVKIIQTLSNNKAVYHLFVIRIKKRDKLMRFLESKGIATGIHYPLPIHLQKSFTHLGYQKTDFPVSEKSSLEILSLPIYPEMSKKEAAYVCLTIKEFFKL